jgi:hypothetical protein
VPSAFRRTWRFYDGPHSRRLLPGLGGLAFQSSGMRPGPGDSEASTICPPRPASSFVAKRLAIATVKAKRLLETGGPRLNPGRHRAVWEASDADAKGQHRAPSRSRPHRVCRPGQSSATERRRNGSRLRSCTPRNDGSVGTWIGAVAPGRIATRSVSMRALSFGASGGYPCVTAMAACARPRSPSARHPKRGAKARPWPSAT